MKKYLISYVSNSGLTILNNLVSAESYGDAIDIVVGTEGVQIIISCIPVKEN